jgi:hypothetical protein
LKKGERENVADHAAVGIVRPHIAHRMQPALAEKKLQRERARDVYVIGYLQFFGLIYLNNGALAIRISAQLRQHGIPLVDSGGTISTDAGAVGRAGQPQTVRRISSHRGCVVGQICEVISSGQIP